MSDVDIKYKNQVIASMDASGTKTLETDGTYCDDDIVVEYTKPSGADVSGVTATAADVLSPKKFINSAGELETGTALDFDYILPQDITFTSYGNFEVPYSDANIGNRIVKAALFYKNFDATDLYDDSLVGNGNMLMAVAQMKTSENNIYFRDYYGYPSGSRIKISDSSSTTSLTYKIYENGNIHWRIHASSDRPRTFKSGRYKIIIDIQ